MGVVYRLTTVRRVAEWIQVERRGAWSGIVEMKEKEGRLEEADVVGARWVWLVEWVSEACGAIGMKCLCDWTGTKIWGHLMTC